MVKVIVMKTWMKWNRKLLGNRGKGYLCYVEITNYVEIIVSGSYHFKSNCLEYLAEESKQKKELHSSVMLYIIKGTETSYLKMEFIALKCSDSAILLIH